MDYKDEFLKLINDEKHEEAMLLLNKYKIHAIEEPFYYANMGWLLNHMERYQEAEIYLQKGLLLFPEDAWMVSQLGFCYDRQEKLDEGLKELLKALKMGYDESWIHGELGWCYKELKEFQKAIEYFENALLDDPHNAWLNVQVAFAYRDAKDYVSAEEYFLKNVQLNPDADAYFDLANFYHFIEQYVKEITCLNQITDSGYQMWKEYHVGVAYYQLKSYMDAIQHLNKAFQEGKDDTNIHTLLGDVYLDNENIEKSKEHYQIALTYYEKALHKEKDTYWIHQEMIWITHKQKDWQKKLSYLKRASKDFPNDSWLMYHFARTYSELNDYEHAENACIYCIEHQQDEKEMYDLYAWNLAHHKKELKAIEILEKRIQKFGAEGWVYGEIGWNYIQLKDYEKAIHAYQNAIDIDQEEYAYDSLAGWCYYQEEKYETALSCLLKAQAKGREDGWLYAVLAETYEQLKNYTECLRCNEVSLSFGFEVEHRKILQERVAKLMKEGVT